jgi:hypothetical protein
MSNTAGHAFQVGIFPPTIGSSQCSLVCGFIAKRSAFLYQSARVFIVGLGAELLSLVSHGLFLTNLII